MNVYVASSWRNPHQADVVRLLRMDHGRENVYDYRHPDPADPKNVGFSWKEVDAQVEGREWDMARLSRALDHPVAAEGFVLDAGALDRASACVLVLPCGRSAHLELGYATGKGKLTVVYAPRGSSVEPELMYRLCDYLCDDVEEVRRALTRDRPSPRFQRDVHEGHRECQECRGCWLHGGCTCSPESLYAATCGKPVRGAGWSCAREKGHPRDPTDGTDGCRDDEHYP